MDITIREARTSDAEAIAEIGKVAWLAAYVDPKTGITSRDVLSRNFDTPERLDKLRERLRKDNEEHGPGGRTWVADMDGEVVGFVTALKMEASLPEGQGKQVKAIYILPCYQGQKIGHRLMEQALSWLGSGEIYANVGHADGKSSDFFKEFGFAPTGETKEVAFSTGKAMAAVVMKRPAAAGSL